MQLRLFRHFIPVSVVLLASSDALLITGAFYQLLSTPEFAIVQGAPSFPVQFSAGLSAAAVTAMVSVGLYGQQSFLDFRLLLSKVAVAAVMVLVLVSFWVTYWRSGLNDLLDAGSFPWKATLIWLACVTTTRGTFLVTLGRGLLKRRIAVLGGGAQAAPFARLAHSGGGENFVPISFIVGRGESSTFRASIMDWSVCEPDALTEIVYRLGASEVVVATDERRGLPVRHLLRCKLADQSHRFPRLLGARNEDDRSLGTQAQLALLLRRLPLRSGRRVRQAGVRRRGQRKSTPPDIASAGGDGVPDLT
jgi:FlaA1/EpsC-like NDP-sugar epimerase